MEKLKLTDICDFQGGSQPPKEQWTNELKDGYIRMLQIRDFTQGKNENEYVKISNTLKTCEDDDILIARYGASVGKVLSGLSGAYNVAIIKSIPDISKVLKKYLYYYFNTDYFQNRIKSVGSRAAQAGFNKTDLKDFEIGIPSLIEQQKIIEILDKSQELIKKRKEQIEALDELVKSKFIEMFGEPFSNTKGWEKQPLNKLVTDDCTISYGIVQTGEEQREGIPVFRPVDIVNNRKPKLEELKKTTEEISNKYKKTILQGNELLMTVRANIGDVCVIDEEFKGCNVGRGIVPIRVKEEINPIFLKYQFESYRIQHELKALSKGITLIQLNMEDLRQFMLIVPPKELQNKFADFVKQVDKLKFEMEKSLKELEDNFNSLMQKAFKGELFD